MTDDIVARLREYLASGGLFNPELMDHAAVRDLLIDCRHEIERMRDALVKIMQKCPYARKDQWCACLNCNCIIARAALEGEKTND